MDTVEMTLGPHEEILSGIYKLHLQIEGEKICAAKIERGYIHRGVEKAFESQRWAENLVYADRIDPENAVFGELAYCLALEKLLGIEVPIRAQKIRMLACEITRISSHLASLGKCSKNVGLETGFHYFFRDREKILDLFELLCGARFSINLLRISGVAHDITEGFIERLLDFLDTLQVRVNEYNDVLTYNYGYLKRTLGKGVVNLESCHQYGLTGVILRAAGGKGDLRKSDPYLLYNDYDFEMASYRSEKGVQGDAHSRTVLKLREIVESINLVRQIVNTLSEGEIVLEPFNQAEIKIPSGEVYTRVESPRGVLGCYILSDGNTKPSRVQFRTPSSFILNLLPALLVNESIDSISTIISSLDFNLSEADR